MAYKEGLYWCESPSCDGQNLISPRSFDRKCVFCGMINTLSRENEFQFRPNRDLYTKLFPDEFNPFMSFLRHEFASEPNLDMMGVEIGVKKYQAGKRLRMSLVIRKGPVYSIRKGFEFGVLNGGFDNCFSIPPSSERDGPSKEFGSYDRNYLSRDPKPLTPSFDDKSFLLGPETDFPTYFPVSLWG